MDFNGKTVLVTGATGLIGSNIVFHLAKNPKTKVIALVRNQNKFDALFPPDASKGNLRRVVQDISLPITLDEPVHYIFHAAGPIASTVIRDTPVDVIAPNLDGLRNCLDLLKDQKISGRLVLFSSGSVYNHTVTEDTVVSEGDTGATAALDGPASVYSETKRMCEIMANAYARQFDLDVVAARISYVYGCPATTLSLAPDTAFFQFIRAVLSGRDIVLNSSSFLKRDNIYIDDAVSGLIAVCLKGESGGAYNVSSGGEAGNYCSVDVMAQKIAECCNALANGGGVKVVYSQEPCAILPGIMLCNQKLKKLGWSLATSLDEGIQKTVKRFYGGLAATF